MNGLTEILKNYCLSLPTKDEDTTRQQLRGVIGRGGFGPRLVKWVENSRKIFPEIVRIEYTENINERGIDVYVEGQQSHVGVGFQIKSDNDLRDANFLPNLKRQITEARAYANLKLYIIVLACSPDNYHKVQYALNEELNQWQAGIPEVLLLVPGKAASLYEACDAPLMDSDIRALLRDRSWHRFFAEVGEDRDNEFLNHWSGLTPDERFVPPGNLEKIERSLIEQPLTVLAGPPTIGKTYTAVQLLYRHFRSGHPVQWIKPPGPSVANFIVASAEASEGFTFRVRHMARRLGMRPPDPPLNRWEFIAARLQPGALILIEDPFGRTDAEYEDSIHTYDFFDLEGCIEGILEEGAATGSRLLMTTRHGLLERWLAQRRGRSTDQMVLPRGMNIIHIGPTAYGKRSGDKEPLLELAKLLLTSAKADISEVPSLAKLISEGVKTPQEVELIVGGLPTAATSSVVNAALHSTPPGALERIAALSRASNDSERLFLLVLVLTGERQDHNDFATAYARLHKALLPEGDASADEAAARAKYWLIYYPHDHTDTNTIFTSAGVPLQWGVSLTPSHPSVIEAARFEIIENGAGFLNRLAAALSRLQGYRQAEEYKKVLVDFFIDFLVGKSSSLDKPFQLNDQALKDLAAEFPSMIEASYTLYGDPINRLLRSWSRLPQIIQTGIVQTVREGASNLAAWTCHIFRYMPIIDFDPWVFYDILIQQNLRTLGVVGFLQPWHYFVSHLDEAPTHLRQLFDSIAVEKPSLFSYVIGDLASSFWETLPEQWKNAILSDHAVNTIWKDRPAALEKIFAGLFGGDLAEPPPELSNLLYRYLDHEDAEFRRVAGTYVLIYWDRLPSHFHDALTKLFRIDTIPSVLMGILYEGINSKNNLHGVTLAEMVLERCNHVGAAWLAQIIREKSSDSGPQNSTFIVRCREKAGDSVLVFELPDLDPAKVQDQLELVQVAWLWKQVTGGSPNLSSSVQIQVHLPGEPPPITFIKPVTPKPDPLIIAAPLLCDIARGLHGSFSTCAHYILGHEAEKLPSLLQEYFSRVENGEICFTQNTDPEAEDITEQVKEAIVSGRRDRETESRDNRHITPAFPIQNLGVKFMDNKAR